MKVCQMTGQEADRLVSLVSELNEDEYGRLRERPDYPLFAKDYATALVLTDLWLFMKHPLGWDMRHYWEALHRPVCRFLTDWTMVRHGVRMPVYTKLLEIAREHTKTWLGVASDLQDIARDTSTTILLRSVNTDKAKEVVGMVKDNITRNVSFRKWCPWVRPSMSMGREEEWGDLRFRVESAIVGQRESTMQAYGYKADATGSHFSKRRYDDIATEKVEKSDVEFRTMLNQYKHDNNLGKAGTRVLVLGTPYAVKGLFWHFERGELADTLYDIFYQPAEWKAFPRPFEIHEPVLWKDRVTLKCGGIRLPDASDWTKNLQFCQVRLLVYSEALKDTHTEIREVEWNDGETIRLNRPLPPVFGQPLKATVSPYKPACPARFTLDEVHLEPKSEAEIDRNSLVIKRRELGSAIYSSQMLLKPVDEEQQVLRWQDFKIVDPEDVPKENLVWVRTVDFASSKKTASSTAMMTCSWHVVRGQAPKCYIRHIKFGNLKPVDILLELLLGVLRVQDWGGALRETIMEEEARKQTLDQFLGVLQTNPYEFFTTMGPPYSGYADKYFADKGPIMIRHRSVTRGRSGKADRLASQIQPASQMGMIYIVRGCEHLDELEEEVSSLTMDGDGNPQLDLLDCLADQIQYGPSKRRTVEREEKKSGLWEETQRMARKRANMAMAIPPWRRN